MKEYSRKYFRKVNQYNVIFLTFYYYLKKYKKIIKKDSKKCFLYQEIP